MGMAVKAEQKNPLVRWVKNGKHFNHSLNKHILFMKTIQLTPKEFILFKTLANRIHLLFVYSVVHGIVYVQADALYLSELGY